MQAGHYFWEHHAQDHARVRLSLLPHQKLDVAVWWNSRMAQPSLLLWVPLHDTYIEFGNLTGNQYGTPLHRIGLGTFVVNTAVQVLQATRDPATKVTGILSNPNDNHLRVDLQEQLAQNRRSFWSQFGLSINPGHYERLSGTVGTLRCATAGLVAGQFSRCVPLSEFAYAGRL